MYNIVFAGDDKYIKYIAVAITSIVKNTDKTKKIIDFQIDINKELHGADFTSSENLEDIEEGYHFHILTDFIQENTKAQLKGLEEELNKIFPTKIEPYIVSDTEFRAFPTWRKNYMTYYRFKLYEILPKDVQKVLYLDGDMLICNDIRNLFAIDLKDESLMAVSESRNCKKIFEKLKYTSTSSELAEDLFANNLERLEFIGNYFNAGLLLIDLNNWRKNKISEKSILFLQNYHASFLDQDALNWVMQGFKEIANSWNMCIGASINTYIKLENNIKYSHNSKEAFESIKNSSFFNIIHYNNKKPWSSLGYRLSAEKINIVYSNFINLWWEYAMQVPYFKEDLLAIKETKGYIKAIEKEKNLLALSTKPLAFKVYVSLNNINRKFQPTIRKIEKPIKQMRNKIRGTLAK